MSDVAIAFVGVGVGALLGLLSALAVETRRDVRRAAALRAQVDSEIVRWIAVVLEAADKRHLVAKPSKQLEWKDVSGNLSLALPPGLYYLVEWLFFTQDKTEYAMAMAQEGVDDDIGGEAILVELRRWGTAAREIRGRWYCYYNRKWLTRHICRARLDSADENVQEELLRELKSVVNARLRDTYGHDIDDEGSLRAVAERASADNEEQRKALEDAKRRREERRKDCRSGPAAP